MDASLIILIVLAALALFVAMVVVGIYNKFVSLRNRFENAYAQIDVQLRRRTDLFEFVLQKIVRRHLASQLGFIRPISVQYHTFEPLLRDCGVVLSALAHAGSSNAGEVAKAFQTGAPHLRGKTDAVKLLPRDACGLGQLPFAQIAER